MKSFLVFFLLCLINMAPRALGLTFDCRGRVNPTMGFLMLVDEQETKLQEISNNELTGPILRGSHRLPPEGFIYVVRIETTHDRILSFFEIWLQESSNSEAIFPAWHFDYGPSFQEPRAQVGVRALDCWVQSEPSPKIFRSEI